MGGGGSNSTVEKNTDPWKTQQPYLSDIFVAAKKNYDAQGPNYYPGSTLAPQSAATQQSLQMGQQATGVQQNVANDAAYASNYALTKAIDVNNNPQLDNAILAAQRPVVQQFTDPGGVLSNIRTGAHNAGQYGGSRQGIAEGVGMGRLGDTLGGISSQMASDAYTKGLGAQTAALSMVPTTQTAQLQPANTMNVIGGQQDQFTQANIDANIARYNYQQNLPAAKIAQYQNLIQGNYGGASIESSSGGAKGNPLMGALGGAAMGGGLAGGLIAAGAPMAWNPYGWAALAAGGLIGALSS